MATSRQDALNIVLASNTSTAAELQIIQNKLIENIQLGAVSTKLKNKDLSGNPQAGSVEVKRFSNIDSSDYGAARSNTYGDKIKETKVVIYLDKDKEIIEEIEKKDIVAYGIPSLVERRALSHARSVIRELDRAFFVEAKNGAGKVEPKSKHVKAAVEELLIDLEVTQNAWVDGVDREDIALVLSVEQHSLLRLEIDELPTGHILTNIGAIGLFHGAPVFVSNRLPSGVGAMAMVFGAVAQPVLFQDYAVEKIGLSNAYAVELFFTYGTKNVTPDLVRYMDYFVAEGKVEHVAHTPNIGVAAIEPDIVTFASDKFIVPEAVDSFQFRDGDELIEIAFNEGNGKWHGIKAAANARVFVSFRSGTCSPKDSLVLRPGMAGTEGQECP